MAIDFPASPTNGQTFTSGSVTYTWDGTKWTAVAAAGSSNSISQGNTNATVTDTGSDGRFVVTTEGSERLRVTAAGLVGVGTTAFPASTPIQVKAVGAGSGGYAIVSANDENAGGVILNASSENSIRIEADPGNLRGSSYINLSVDGTERARIDSSGRLLVGTSSALPVYYNSASTWNGIFQVARSSQDAVANFSIWDSTASTYTTYGGAQIHLSACKSGTVGSHTSGALASGDSIASINFNASDGTNFRNAARIEAVVDAASGTADVPGRLVFATTADGASSPTERMRISANGETTFYSSVNTLLGLRIGEASGWSGNPAIHTSSNVGYIIIRNGTSGGVGLSGGGTSWSSLSDENYKTDLTPITDAATKVRSLRTVTGRYIDDDEDTSRSFLIAQDVEAVLPQAVSTADSGQKLLSYTDTIPLLTAALKEALGKIETLEAKVAALESV